LSLGSWVLCLLCLASSSYGETDYYSPENTLKFADYLYQTKDYLRAAGEYQRYLFHSPEDADNALFRIGLCYQRAGDTVKAVDFFGKVGAESRFHFAASYQIAYTYFLSDQYENSVRFLDQTLGGTKNTDERGQLKILTAFNYLHQRRWSDAEGILQPLTLKDAELNGVASSLRVRAREGVDLPRKNPALAGLFSTVIPGTGKMYCGQYGDGIYSLIVVGVTGLLAWNGFQENGVHSVKGWLLGSVSAVFYAGNIYGSAIAARIYNRQLEADLLKRLPVPPDDYKVLTK
jgi:tetratricopeptide (TPR) repeat protein